MVAKLIYPKPKRGLVEDSLEQAFERYRMWHQKHPSKVEKRSFEFPPTVYAMGTARDIVYSSDKWERKGNNFDYHHTFDSHPTVYGLKGSGRAKSVKQLLQVDDLDGTFPLPVLADVKELVLHDGKKERKISFVSHLPLLCCTLDKQGLVIFADNDPMFIRGGTMVVTPRGIVR